MDENGNIQEIGQIDNRRKPAAGKVARVGEDEYRFGEFIPKFEIAGTHLHCRRGNDVGNGPFASALFSNGQSSFFN